MLGRKLSKRLAADGRIGRAELASLSLVDIAAPVKPTGCAGVLATQAADISAPGEAEKLVANRPNIIFHLAAIVSGEAEADFERGYRINLDGTRLLLEAIRHEGMSQPYCPRVVFASSIAVFGAPLPDAIPR